MNMRIAKESCSDCPIRHRAVCAECDPDEFAVLETIKSYATIPKGGSIARAGEPLSHLSSVVSGCATVTKTLADGRRQMVGLMLPSDFIGRPGRSKLTFDIDAASEVTLCRFERKAFEALLHASPNVAHRLLTMTLDDLEVARDWQVLLGRYTARERVVHFLLSLLRRETHDNTNGVFTGSATLTLPLSRELIADYLGLTIETTSRQFSALRKDSLIETPTSRQIILPDLARIGREFSDDAVGMIE